MRALRGRRARAPGARARLLRVLRLYAGLLIIAVGVEQLQGPGVHTGMLTVLLLLCSWGALSRPACSTAAAAPASLTTQKTHLGVPVGSTFHVSASAGNDDNSGASPSEALRTLEAAGSRMKAGDTLLLARGDAWMDETLSTAGAFMTVGAYGAAALPAPLIQHGRTLNSEKPCAAFTDADSLAVSDLHISGCAGGLRITPPVLSNATDVSVQRVFFADIRTPFLVYSPPNPAWAAALTLTGGHFSNLTVKNCVGVRIDVFFKSQAHVTTMHLDGNTVQSCDGNCYALGLGIGLLMENSVFLRDTSTRLFMYGVTDIIVGGMSGHNVVRNNDFNQRSEYQGGPDGCAFDFETSAQDFEVVGNVFYKSWGAGLMIFGHDTASHNILVANNTFAECGCVQNRGDRGGIAVMVSSCQTSV